MAKNPTTPDQRIDGLRKYNVVAGFFYLVQAVGLGYALILLSNQILFPAMIDFPSVLPGVLVLPQRIELVDVMIGAGVVGFLLLSAFFHFLISSPTFFPRYKAGLKLNHNYFRWVEYSLSSSVMIWLVAQLTGVSDFAAMVGIFSVYASIIFFDALQNKYESLGNRMGLLFILGAMTGLVPSIIIVLYTIQPVDESAADSRGFVYGIIVALFIFFNTFAFNQTFQYKKVGPWKNYLFGEATYITLSLVAKTILAWQVFSGAIIPAIVG